MSLKLEDTENWLYEDGEDQPKQVYIDKLAELKVIITTVVVFSSTDLVGEYFKFYNCSGFLCRNLASPSRRGTPRLKRDPKHSMTWGNKSSST